MTQFVKVIGDDSIFVMNTSNGESITIKSSDSRYEKALAYAKTDDFHAILNMDAKVVVADFVAENSDLKIEIINGKGTVTLHNYAITDDLDRSITDRIIKMSQQGFKCDALVKFLRNLYQNPSSTAIKELYGFIDSCDLPITEDGHFIAYKIVRDDYLDIYSGTMYNSIGSRLSMPRSLVDDNRDRTCSSGLHFCSKEYLSQYGSGRGKSDRCMLVKINPRDVVSIPSDYNNAKGRTCVYEVVGEMDMPEGWRNVLPQQDYTSSAVVGDDGWDYENEDEMDSMDEATSDELDPKNDPEYMFEIGYRAGWDDHKDRNQHKSVDDFESTEHEEGYTQGWKDHKNHRRNQFGQ